HRLDAQSVAVPADWANAAVEGVHAPREPDDRPAARVLQRSPDPSGRRPEAADHPIERLWIPGGSARQSAAPDAYVRRGADGSHGARARGEQGVSPQERRRRRANAEAPARRRWSEGAVMEPEFMTLGKIGI